MPAFHTIFSLQMGPALFIGFSPHLLVHCNAQTHEHRVHIGIMKGYLKVDYVHDISRVICSTYNDLLLLVEAMAFMEGL